MSFIDREANLYATQEAENHKIVEGFDHVGTLIQYDGHASVLETLIRGYTPDPLPTAREVAEYREACPEKYEMAKEQYTTALQRAVEENPFIGIYFTKIIQNISRIDAPNDEPVDSPHATFRGKDSISKKWNYSNNGDRQSSDFIYSPNSED